MFAVNAFRLMAQIEKLLAREKKSAYYTDIARRLADSAVQDFPVGFWNPEKCRFIDWIDSKGIAHDRIDFLLKPCYHNNRHFIDEVNYE